MTETETPFDESADRTDFDEPMAEDETKGDSTAKKC
jgi:hypothetical protein